MTDELLREPAQWDVAALFRPHRADLVRLAALLVRDLPTPEDVVQDVFARLHARADSPPDGDAIAYARAAVLNGCRSVLRRRALAQGRRGNRLAVTRFATRTGRVLGVPQRVPDSTLLYAQLSSDGSGAYLIVNDQLGVVSGWLHDGRFHPFGLHVVISAIAW